MSEKDFNLRVSDRLPTIFATLKNRNGTVINLTDTTVQFVMRRLTAAGVAEPPVTAAPAQIVDPLQGSVAYQWQSADTASAGTFLAVWVVTHATGQQQTVPNASWNQIRITPR